MRLTRVKITNHARLQDMDISVRDHLVVVGANDVGKTSLLRLVNGLLASGIGQLYQALSLADLRDPGAPMVVEAVLGGFSDAERALFHREIDVTQNPPGESLTVRLEVEVDVDDPDAVVVQRFLPGTADRRSPTREQLAAFGWRYLPATRGAGGALLDGPNSALRLLLDTLDLGAEEQGLTSALDEFNDKLHTSEHLSALRNRIADHLARSMPRTITSDDLAVRTAADPGASALQAVSMYFARDGGYVPITEQSDGLRQLMALTLFDLAEGQANIVAVDEPELHLHPSSQRTVAELFVKSTNQKVVCTHSPFILQRFEPSHVVVIAHDGTARQVPDEKLNAVAKVQAHWWAPQLLEALTARFVIVVEGLADVIMVKAVARQMGISLDRIGATIFQLDGADKFPHVYRLLGKDGFGVRVLALGDEKEKGVFTNAFGGKESTVLGVSVFSANKDLEDEYCRALGGPEVTRILENAGACRGNSVLQSCQAPNREAVTADGVAAYIRKNMKVEAATAVADALTPETAAKITPIVGMLDRLRTLADA